MGASKSFTSTFKLGRRKATALDASPCNKFARDFIPNASTWLTSAIYAGKPLNEWDTSATLSLRSLNEHVMVLKTLSRFSSDALDAVDGNSSENGLVIIGNSI